AGQCPIIAPEFNDPRGVPVDISVFGGRRATNVPVVNQSLNWEHGVFIGATVSSEQTAAAEGAVGALRRDPFAMLPFCGYNMGDYWAHWLHMGKVLGDKAPKIFQVNWFRKGADGKFLWPGYGENSRVLAWAVARVLGQAGSVKTAIGQLPVIGEFDVEGLGLSDDVLAQLFAIDPAAWLAEADLTEEYFAQFGERLPVELTEQLAALRERLNAAK
ncbi:MAG: phosphoenolpyruvate carboxykinase (GTP), partial [Bifidobacteriaceae bacterium]|nr:phosphoenolpyruvate carboxykinase (GTP) [Bifidobacteriaceae bacterium]